MRCPVCRSETPAALPRCTRCNAFIDDAATAQDPSPEPWPPEPWTPEPAPERQDFPTRPADDWQPSNWPPEPPSAPPAGHDAPGWQPDPWPPDPPAPHEQTTSLAPEPWAVPRPQMWSPPPPARRRRGTMPYILITVGAVVLAAVALGIILWPSDKKNASNDSAAQQQQSQVTEEPQQQQTTGNTETASPDLRTQAGKVDALLTSMGGSRSELGPIVADGTCQASSTIAGVKKAVGERESQLATAQALEVEALGGQGPQLKEALTTSLQASLDADKAYLKWATDCSDSARSEGDDISGSRATPAKKDVVRLWNPIAQQAGLPTRNEDGI